MYSLYCTCTCIIMNFTCTCIIESKKTIKEVKSNVHKTKDPQALPNISNSLLRVPPVTMATGLGPIAMATGLQVLQMLGLTLDNNNDTPTTSDKCTTVRPDNVLVNNAISLSMYRFTNINTHTPIRSYMYCIFSFKFNCTFTCTFYQWSIFQYMYTSTYNVHVLCTCTCVFLSDFP